VLDDTFGNSEVLVSTDDVFIDTKINDWIILVITWILLLVLILVASRRVADWIRSNRNIGFKLNISKLFPVLHFTHCLLGRLKVNLRSNNIFIKFWCLVVFDGVLVILLFPVPLMTKLLLSPVKGVIVGVHILIFSEVWDEVIFWMGVVMRMEVLSVS